MLARLFASLHHLEMISLQVFEPDSQNLIIMGDLRYSALTLQRPHSDKMWPNQLGMRFQIADDRFGPLSAKNIIP